MSLLTTTFCAILQAECEEIVQADFAHRCIQSKTLFCFSCGSTDHLVRQYCRRCYTAARRDQRYFSGLRQNCLARDHYRCAVCGQTNNKLSHLHIHHRRPGISKLALLITLCPVHHSIVHRRRVLSEDCDPLLVQLWREQHPRGAIQRILPFDKKLLHDEIRPHELALAS